MTRTVLPTGFFASIGVAVGVQIASVGLALADGSAALIVGGLAIFAAISAAQVLRLRRATDGLLDGEVVRRVVLGAGAAASWTYAVAFAAATWSGATGRPGLVVLCSVFGGAAYALSGRRWMHHHGGGPGDTHLQTPLAWLLLVSAACAGGLTILLLGA